MSKQTVRWSRMLQLGVVALASLSAAAFLATPALANAPDGPVRKAGTSDVVPDSYIVVLKDAAIAKDRVDAKARELGSRFGGRIGHTYRDAIRGFEIKLPAVAARRLAGDSSIAYVEENGIDSIAGTQSPTPSYGLDRIDKRSLPLNGSFGYPTTASGVKAYIIDSGIRFSHIDFGGRAISGVDEIDGGTADDAYWHGTHVAGIVGGTTYGVAKGITLVAVRVLDPHCPYAPNCPVTVGVPEITPVAA